MKLKYSKLDQVSWNLIFYLGITLTTVSMSEKAFVSASANDWSLAPVEEYVSAYINLTYMDGDKLHTEKAEIGKFGGGSGKIGPASGVVVHVHSINKTDSHFGCDFPYGNQIPNEPWIALVKRGNCTFEEKLRNAFLSNASALVVYAREDKEQLDKMKLNDCNLCNIPTVFTYRWKGEDIARNVDRGIRVYMYITVGETISKPYNGINRTSVLFVSVSFIVLMIISLAWLIFYYVQRFRYLHAKDRLAQRLCNAAKKALAKIPTRNVKLTDKEVSGEGECCAVCIEPYRSGDILRTLPCRHEFHKCCVDPWLLEHRTCPFCKMDILKYYGFIFSGSQESILHLDMDDGILNSSESRETESPNHENHHVPHQRHHHNIYVHHHITATVSAVHEHSSSPPPNTTTALLTINPTPQTNSSAHSLRTSLSEGENVKILVENEGRLKGTAPIPSKSVSETSLQKLEPVENICSSDYEHTSYQPTTMESENTTSGSHHGSASHLKTFISVPLNEPGSNLTNIIQTEFPLISRSSSHDSVRSCREFQSNAIYKNDTSATLPKSKST